MNNKDNDIVLNVDDLEQFVIEKKYENFKSLYKENELWGNIKKEPSILDKVFDFLGINFQK